MPSTFISNDNQYATTIMMTDTIYITTSDNYSIGVFYLNNIMIDAGMYLNGTLNKL